MLRRLNPAVESVPLAVANDRIDRDRIPPQTAAMTEGAAQLLTDGVAGLPLLGASPSPCRVAHRLGGPSGLPPMRESCTAVGTGDQAAGPVSRSC